MVLEHDINSSTNKHITWKANIVIGQTEIKSYILVIGDWTYIDNPKIMGIRFMKNYVSYHPLEISRITQLDCQTV